VNEVSVRNVNDPMPTGQGDIGTILLSPFGDGCKHGKVDSFWSLLRFK
jgi:hypothetical protein